MDEVEGVTVKDARSGVVGCGMGVIKESLLKPAEGRNYL